MLEPGEDVALAPETLTPHLAALRQRGQLEGHLALHPAVHLPREPDLSHAAAAERMHEFEGPDPLSGGMQGRRAREGREPRHRFELLQALPALVRVEEPAQHRRKLRCASSMPASHAARRLASMSSAADSSGSTSRQRSGVRFRKARPRGA